MFELVRSVVVPCGDFKQHNFVPRPSLLLPFTCVHNNTWGVEVNTNGGKKGRRPGNEANFGNLHCMYFTLKEDTLILQ